MVLGLVPGTAAQLKPGVALYGGFQGSEATRNEQDWKLLQTTISANGTGVVVTIAPGANRDTRVDGFTIEHGRAQQGGGILCSNASPVIANNLIRYNKAENWKAGGGIFCCESKAWIQNNRFDGNSTEGEGGAIHLYESRGRVAHNVIVRNAVRGNTENAAGIYGFNLIQFTIVNNTLLWNTTKEPTDSALTLTAAGKIAEATVANNLIAFNSSGVRGLPTLHFRNNCVYGNGSANYAGFDEDPTGTNGNLSVDPEITDVNLFSGPGNHHLLPRSPCIGAGDVSLVRSDDVDLDGDPRLVDGAVDIGADEFVIHPLAIQSDLISTSDKLRLTAVGQSDVPYTWERSTNLTDWLKIQTQATREGVVRIEESTEEPIATYRVVSE